MKKYLLSVALLTAVAVSAKAQTTFGIKAGANFSKINTDNLSTSTKTGYQVGVFGRLGSNTYLQPEIYLGSRGGKATAANNTFESDVTFTTLNVPLLLGGRIVGTDKLNLRIMAGPIFTYTLSKDQTISGSLANAAYADFGNYSKSTLGYQAGAGVDIGAITADLRYEGSLTKINEKYGQRPTLWALSVGFKIF